MIVESVDPASGPDTGGTLITITGELLSGPAEDSESTVGGNTCTNLTVTSDNEINCQTPPGTEGSADVIVANNELSLGNDTDTLADGFEFVTACGIEASGSCLLTGSATCSSQTCCEQVCAEDSYCCNNEWDSVCVGLAQDICAVIVESVDPASGPDTGGTLITITGELLSGPAEDSESTVGGNTCTNLTVTNDNEINCQTPPGTEGSADVIVANNELSLGNDTDTLADGFEFLLLPDFIFSDRFEP